MKPIQDLAHLPRHRWYISPRRAIVGLLALFALLTVWGAAEAQTCDIEHIRGTYQPEIPGQSSECVFEIMPLVEPWLVQTRLTCPGTPATTNGAVYQLDEEGHCALHIGQDISGVLIAEEGEEIVTGIFSGMSESIPNVDEQGVCQAAADQGLLIAPHVGDVLTVEATNINDPNGPDTNPISQFSCEGTYFKTSWGVVQNFGPINIGRLNLEAVSEPTYQPAEGTLRGSLRSNGANPPDFAGTVQHAPAFVPVDVTLTRGELPY